MEKEVKYKKPETVHKMMLYRRFFTSSNKFSHKICNPYVNSDTKSDGDLHFLGNKSFLRYYTLKLRFLG